MNKVKQKTYLNCFAIFSVIAGLLYLNIVYLTDKEKVLSSQIINKKQEIERLRAQNRQIESARNVYKDIQEKVNEVSEYVLSYSEISNFVIEIREIAQKNNVVLDINFLNKEKEFSVKDTPYFYYDIESSGGFNNIMKFLTALENLKYTSNIENITLRSQSRNKFNSGKTGTVILNSRIKVYVDTAHQQ